MFNQLYLTFLCFPIQTATQVDNQTDNKYKRLIKWIIIQTVSSG